MAFKVQVNGSGAEATVNLSGDNCTAEVFAFGALLNKFSIPHQGGDFNVIHGFKNVEDARQNITPAFQSAKLSPFVCRTKNGRYHFGENNYHFSKYYDKTNALHGLIFDEVFEITGTNENESSASVKLQYEYNKSDEGYPFRYRCEVTYTLQANNTLTITTEVFNLDDKLIPVADGWHPYFTLGDPVNECQLEFQSKEMLEFDETLIPTGKLIPYQEFGSLKDFGTRWYDNCFTVNFAECQPLCVFRNAKRNIQVEIYPEESYPYLQFYTPDDRKSIAIENLSAAPDAFNNGFGLKTLEPQQSASFTTKFVIKSL